MCGRKYTYVGICRSARFSFCHNNMCGVDRITCGSDATFITVNTISRKVEVQIMDCILQWQFSAHFSRKSILMQTLPAGKERERVMGLPVKSGMW